MDLIERGRSLSELGRTLRWSDVYALLIHLPPDAHVRKAAAAFDSPQEGSGPSAGQQRAPVTSVAQRDAKAREAAARIRAQMSA